ncbi:GLPGLI family protein [Larkinella insperata]|nr:GLPGLI family protein [Larkinella insperata]
MKTLMYLLSFLLLTGPLALAQSGTAPSGGAPSSAAPSGEEGVVTYERSQNWAKMYASMPFLSQEEKDREINISKNWEGYKQKMRLYFSPAASLYTYENKDEANDYGYAWRQDEYIINRNFEKERMTDIVETLGKTYVIEDSLNAPKWKVLNQIKEVAGYVCMKATMQDPVKGYKVTAWYAQDLPVPAGPERYFGLPGVILELDLNDGVVLIEAKKVELKSVTKELALPAKIKGRRISDQAFDDMLKKHIAEQIKAQRNPFWSIRY